MAVQNFRDKHSNSKTILIQKINVRKRTEMRFGENVSHDQKFYFSK